MPYFVASPDPVDLMLMYTDLESISDLESTEKAYLRLYTNPLVTYEPVAFGSACSQDDYGVKMGFITD